MQDWIAFQRRERQMRRQRNYGDWCDKAKTISTVMSEKHSLNPLSEQNLFRFAHRLKWKSVARSIHRAVDNEPSGSAIARTISRELEKSIGRIAAFARDAENGERNQAAALRAIRRAAQRWEMTERRNHRSALIAWQQMPDRDHSERPQDRLEGHIEEPAVMTDGTILPSAGIMVRNWFDQARFIAEILKDQDIAVRHSDDLEGPSAEQSLAGGQAPRLFTLTYPNVRFGSRGADGSFDTAAGFTFSIEVVKALTGKTLSAETIHKHRQNYSRPHE